MKKIVTRIILTLGLLLGLTAIPNTVNAQVDRESTIDSVESTVTISDDFSVYSCVGMAVNQQTSTYSIDHGKMVINKNKFVTSGSAWKTDLEVRSSSIDGSEKEYFRISTDEWVLCDNINVTRTLIAHINN